MGQTSQWPNVETNGYLRAHASLSFNLPKADQTKVGSSYCDSNIAELNNIIAPVIKTHVGLLTTPCVIQPCVTMTGICQIAGSPSNTLVSIWYAKSGSHKVMTSGMGSCSVYCFYMATDDDCVNVWWLWVKKLNLYNVGERHTSITLGIMMSGSRGHEFRPALVMIWRNLIAKS